MQAVILYVPYNRVMCYVGYCDHLFYSVKCDLTLGDHYIFLLHCQLIICFDGI